MTSSKTVYQATIVKMSGGGDSPFTLSQVHCSNPECQIRRNVEKALKCAEAMVLEALDERDQMVSPQLALYSLASALMGGVKETKKDPANFCKLMLKLALDEHWATTPEFPITQAELQNWIRDAGWLDGEHKVLDSDLAQRQLRVHEDSHSIESFEVLDCTCNFWYGEFSMSELTRNSDSTGWASLVGLTVGEGRTNSHISLIGPAPYREMKRAIEIQAGKALRAALVKVGYTGLGRVTPAPEPGDIQIEGFPHPVQHTKADSRPWSQLAKGPGPNPYQRSEPVANLFKALDGSITRKGSAKYSASDRAKMVLLLDLGPVRIPMRLLERYRDSRARGVLRNAAYAQIWVASSQFSDESIQLA